MLQEIKRKNLCSSSLFVFALQNPSLSFSFSRPWFFSLGFSRFFRKSSQWQFLRCPSVQVQFVVTYSLLQNLHFYCEWTAKFFGRPKYCCATETSVNVQKLLGVQNFLDVLYLWTFTNFLQVQNSWNPGWPWIIDFHCPWFNCKWTSFGVFLAVVCSFCFCGFAAECNLQKLRIFNLTDAGRIQHCM